MKTEELAKGIKYNIDSINEHLNIITAAAKSILSKSDDPEVCEDAIKIITSADASRRHLGGGNITTGNNNEKGGEI